MAQRIMYVEGFDGQVELMTDRVVIHRQGLWNMFLYGFNAKREIPLSAISEVLFRPPLLLGMGQIEFVRSGRSQNEHSKKNYSLVKFKRAKLQEFELFKEKVFELMHEQARQRQNQQ